MLTAARRSAASPALHEGVEMGPRSASLDDATAGAAGSTLQAAKSGATANRAATSERLMGASAPLVEQARSHGQVREMRRALRRRRRSRGRAGATRVGQR